jgi:5'-nucleotidase
VPAHFFVPGLFTPPDADGRHKLVWCDGEDVSPPDCSPTSSASRAAASATPILDYRKLGHA